MEGKKDREWAKAYIDRFCKTYEKDGDTVTEFPSTYYWTILLLVVVASKVYRLEDENKELKARIAELEEKYDRCGI
jgi:hypothetical protein